MSGKVLFHNNTASSGTVLIFAKNSLLITTDYSIIDFQNNHAINYGGVFYITTEESYEASMSLQDIQSFHSSYFDNWEVDGFLIISITEYFVRVEGSRSHVRLTFVNNTAGKGGDVLYGHWAMVETGTVCSASRTYLTCHSRLAYLSFHLLHLECVSAMKLDSLTT